MRKPKRLKRWSDPAISPDGKHLWVQIEAEDGETADLEIPFEEIGDHVQFLVSVANFIGEHREEQDEPPVPMTRQEYSPIPVVGVGVALGRTPNETILHVQLAGFSLGFALDSSKVAEFGRGLAQSAQLLSAGQGKAQ